MGRGLRCRCCLYFRIFNPILQGEKFDKEGDYVKKWVPEIKDLPKSLFTNHGSLMITN